MIDRLNHATTDVDTSVVNVSQPRSKFVRYILAICAGLFFVAFFALGSWQLIRLQWKLDLIARVEQRVHAPAVDLPLVSQWGKVNAADDEYRHVRLRGTYRYQDTSLVMASTVLGSGFWVLTPLVTQDDQIVWINRGYIPSSLAAQFQSEKNNGAGTGSRVVSIAGLLRMSEPNGGFLRHNEPAAQRWFSRDIAALSAAHKLSHAAPYFVDLERHQSLAINDDTEYPVAGLTVISFHNNHLVYALTWYALALMVAGGFFYVRKDDRRLRRELAEPKFK